MVGGLSPPGWWRHYQGNFGRGSQAAPAPASGTPCPGDNRWPRHQDDWWVRRAREYRGWIGARRPMTGGRVARLIGGWWAGGVAGGSALAHRAWRRLGRQYPRRSGVLPAPKPQYRPPQPRSFRSPNRSVPAELRLVRSCGLWIVDKLWPIRVFVRLFRGVRFVGFGEENQCGGVCRLGRWR